MEYDHFNNSYILQPNEVLESSQLRITNIGKKAESVSRELLEAFDCRKLTTGPHVERGLEFRLRVGEPR